MPPGKRRQIKEISSFGIYSKDVLFFFGSLFFNQISGNELEEPCGAGWRELPQGSRLGRSSLWSRATLTVVRTAENLCVGCKQADGFESNAGPFKDDPPAFYVVDTTAFQSYCFPGNLVSRGL